MSISDYIKELQSYEEYAFSLDEIKRKCNLQDIDLDQIIESFKAYMKFSVNSIPTQKQFLLNIEEKENDPDFTNDMDGLIRPEIKYNQQDAFEWLKNEVLTKLR